jgi:hypothetical protein
MSKQKKVQNKTVKTELQNKNSSSGNKKNIAQSNNLNSNKNNNFSYILLAIAAISILTYFAYQPAMDNDFVDWDDNTYVLDNTMVRNEKVPVSEIFKQPVSLNYHPITMLTMRWNNNDCKDCVYGISAKPFIYWNIILHILNSIFVFLLAFRLSKENWFVGLFSSLVFALHPMHVESVAWVSERKDVLYVFFFLAGLLSYDKYLTAKYFESKKQYSWLIFSLGLFVLSCLSKAMAVVFPLVMILMDFWRNPESNPITALKQSFKPAKLVEYLPFFAVAMFFGLMAMNVQSGGDFYGMLDKRGQEVAVNKFDTFSILMRLHFAAYGFCMYIIKFFVPNNLCTFHPYPTLAEYHSSSIYWGLFILSLIMAAVALLSLKKTKIVLFGTGFYFFTVAFVLQFISVGVVIMADRYSYLPYVGFAFMLAMLVETYLPKSIKYVIYGISAIAALFWMTSTKSQVDSWQDSEALWGKVISTYPNQEQPHSIRGNFYGKMASRSIEQKNLQKQQEYMNKAAEDFQIAIKLKSERPDVYEGMGNIFGMRGDNQKALEMYSLAIKYNPNKATIYINRGIAYSFKGDLQASLKDMEKAVQLEPKPNHIFYRGIARQRVGDLAGAKADYENVLKLDPGNKQATEQLKTIK